jgi:hypothetical protein
MAVDQENMSVAENWLASYDRVVDIVRDLMALESHMLGGKPSQLPLFPERGALPLLGGLGGWERLRCPWPR